jgi:hypothetical protein
MLYSFALKADVKAESVVINGLGIDDLAAKVDDVNYKVESQSADQMNSFANNGSTTFNNVSGSLNMYHGVLTLDNFTFYTLKSTGSATGSIDIYKKNINLLGLFEVGGARKPLHLQLNVTDDLFSPKNTLELNKNF